MVAIANTMNAAASMAADVHRAAKETALAKAMLPAMVPKRKRDGIPNLGIGIGLRPVHFNEIFSEKPSIDLRNVSSR